VNFASQCPGGSADQTRANNAVQQTLAAAQDGFRYTNHIPQQERQFTGTVEEFAKAFPDIMKRVVSDSFRYKTNWEKEADYVIAAARTCDEAISQVAQRIKSLGALQGTKYEACSPSINVSQRLNQNVNLQAQRGMVMTVTLPPGQNSTGQFILQVVFTRLPSDVITSAQSTMLPDRRYVVNDYRIFTATINPTPRSDKSLPTTTAGSPTPPQILAPPAYRTLDPASFKQFDGSNGFSRGIDASVVSGVVLDLNLIHLQPTVLNDPKFLNYFIRLNNCGNLEIDAQMNNEFVYPKMAAFYKDKAAEILKAVPSEIGGLSFRKAVTLGQYDLARMAFPLTTELRLDHFDIARQFSCVSTQFFGGLPTYQIRFNPVNFREMPMDELKAREFVAGSPGSRGVVLKFDLDIVEQQPTTLNGKVVFLGKIRTVTALRTDYPIPLAVLSSAGDTDRVVSPTGSPVGPPSNALPNSPEVSAHADAYGRSFLQYIRSCNAGIGRACQLAGYCYENGRGVDKDIEMARQYYQKGCDINDPGSCTHVKMLK
jgi:hypothetical protein